MGKSKWTYYEIWNMDRVNWGVIYYRILGLIGQGFPNYRQKAFNMLMNGEFSSNRDMLHYLAREFNRWLKEYGYRIRVVSR